MTEIFRRQIAASRAEGQADARSKPAAARYDARDGRRRTAGAPRRACTRNAIQAAMGEMTSGVSFAGELTRRDTA
jgi:hypothetical protein